MCLRVSWLTTCVLGVQWFTKAGFTDVKIKRIGPKWYRGVRRHGLIMGCSVTGVKPKVRVVHRPHRDCMLCMPFTAPCAERHAFWGKAGESPLDMGPKLETTGGSGRNPFGFLFRLILGTTAGAYFFILPIYMWLKNLIWPRNAPGF